MHHATSPEPEAELVSDITFGEGEVRRSAPSSPFLLPFSGVLPCG